MKKINLLLPILFIAGSLTITGCKKEGCTDPTADNYNEKATKDDGSCTNSCDNNTFKIIQLGSIETIASSNRVSMLYQLLDQNDKGVPGKNNVSLYTLKDYEQEMTTNVEAEVTIESFGTIPTEINTAIVIDISKSVEGMVGLIKQAAQAFVNQSMSEQKIAIYTFDGNAPQRRINYTNNKTQLLSAITSIPEDDLGTSTNLYQAIQFVENQMPDDIYSTQQIKQTNMLIFTDGRETADPTPEALNNALYAIDGRTVFVAALKSADLDENTLKNKIASNVNNYIVANNINELESKFLQIQKDIEKLSKSVYWLHYISPRKGDKFWDIELGIKNNCNTNYDAYSEGSYSSYGF